jgi:hypothetical protein
MFLMRTIANSTSIESYIWNSSLSTIISKEWHFAIFHPVKKVKKVYLITFLDSKYSGLKK